MANNIFIKNLIGRTSSSVTIDELLLPPINPSVWLSADYHTASLSFGQEVGTWFDHSGNNNHFTNDGSGSGPTYTKLVFPGGKPGLLFGGNRRMRSALNVLSGSTANTTFIMLKPMASPLDVVFEQGASEFSFENTASLNGKFFIGGTGESLPPQILTASAENIITLVADGGQLTTYAVNSDQLSYATGSPGTPIAFSGDTGTGSLYLGGDANSDSLYTNAYVAELLIYDRVLTQPEISEVWRYLYKKYSFSYLPANPFLYMEAANFNSLPGSGSLNWFDLGGRNNSASFKSLKTSSLSGGYIDFAATASVSGSIKESLVRGRGNQTFSVWFNVPILNTGIQQVLLYENTNLPAYTRMRMHISETGSLSFGGRGSSNEPQGNFLAKIMNGAPISINTWYNFVGVWDVTNTQIRLYLNGAERAGTNSGAGAVEAHNSDAPIGVYMGEAAGSHFFSGKIAQILVYNRVLTPAEILRIYNFGAPRFA